MVHTKILKLAAVASIAAALSACGTFSGAAVGGVAGHAASGGSTLGTIGGAAVGGVIGNEIGKR